MKTKIHTIQGASLKRIEQLDHLGTPDWVPHIVAIPGTETSALDEAMVETQHFSGLLRSISFAITGDIKVLDEDGNEHDLEELLDGAAERLDQAHEEWLEQRKHSVRHQEPKLVTLAKGGTRERKVRPEDIEIPDIWNASFLAGKDGEQIRDVWHLAHDLKRHAIEEATE